MRNDRDKHAGRGYRPAECNCDACRNVREKQRPAKSPLAPSPPGEEFPSRIELQPLPPPVVIDRITARTCYFSDETRCYLPENVKSHYREVSALEDFEAPEVVGLLSFRCMASGRVVSLPETRDERPRKYHVLKALVCLS